MSRSPTRKVFARNEDPAAVTYLLSEIRKQVYGEVGSEDEGEEELEEEEFEEEAFAEGEEEAEEEGEESAMAAEGEVNAVIFFRDPLDKHPHEPDVQMLMRICDVHNIPLATNPATAKLILERLER